MDKANLRELSDDELRALSDDELCSAVEPEGVCPDCDARLAAEARRRSMDRPIIGEGGEMDNAEFVEMLAVNQAPGDEALAQRLEAGLNRLAGLDFMLLDLVRKMLQGERLTFNTDNPASVRRSSSLAVAASGDSGEEEPDELVPDPIVCREFNISAMTLWRWDHDHELAALGLPPPVIIRKRKFRVRRQLKSFKQRMLRRAIEHRAEAAMAREVGAAIKE